MIDGKSVKIFDEQATLPGFYVRYLSSIYDEPAFDVLFIDDDGICLYSNDIFSSEQEAINYAEKCNAKTADYERWDYCAHRRWILTQHIEAKSS